MEKASPPATFCPISPISFVNEKYNNKTVTAENTKVEIKKIKFMDLGTPVMVKPPSKVL